MSCLFSYADLRTVSYFSLMHNWLCSWSVKFLFVSIKFVSIVLNRDGHPVCFVLILVSLFTITSSLLESSAYHGFMTNDK